MELCHGKINNKLHNLKLRQPLISLWGVSPYIRLFLYETLNIVILFKAAAETEGRKSLGLTVGGTVFIHGKGAFLSSMCADSQNSHRRWDAGPLWEQK